MSNDQTLNEIQNAIRAHGMWKMRLKTAIKTGSSEISPATVKCDNLCDFGKWLYDDSLPASVRDTQPYKLIKRLHAEFHETASTVLKTALDGNSAKSNALLEGVFTDQSNTLVQAL